MPHVPQHQPTAWNNHNNWIHRYNQLTSLLSWSIEQSPFWEANRFVASHRISRVLLNPKVHYCIYNCSPPVPILSQLNPVHIPTSHLRKIHPNIILPPMPWFPQWSLSFRFSQQNPIHASLIPYPRCMSRTCYFSLCYHPHNVGWGIQIIKLLIM
jgi:hypothetical protein